MKCYCPKCKYQFMQTPRENILDVIKSTPGCSLSDIQWEIRMDVKNVMVNVNKLEAEGLVKVIRPKPLLRKNGSTANRGKVKCYDINYSLNGCAK